MIALVERFIAMHNLASTGQPLWVGVSGGVDSMVLLHVLRKLDHPCHVVHIDHSLRGAESAADLNFVADHCKAKRIPFRTFTVDLDPLLDQGLSVQLAARKMRYNCFNEALKDGPQLLATAHHADDSVETFIMQLMQGMGPGSWGAIPPKNGAFIKPLLEIPKTTIEAYARGHNISYRNDTSNADHKYMRNQVRHELLPLMDDIRSGSRQVLHRNMALLRELSAVVERQIDLTVNSLAIDDNGTIHLPFSILKDSRMPQAILLHMLRDKGFHPVRISDILTAIELENTGARFSDGDHFALVDRDEVLIGRSQGTLPNYVIRSFEDLTTELPISVSRTNTNAIDLRSGRTVAWLDANTVPFPWILRPWQAGDRMYPIGLGGSKLISDILINEKVSRDKKDRTYVLISNDRIVWLCGYRIAEGSQGSVTSETILKCIWKG